MKKIRSILKTAITELATIPPQSPPPPSPQQSNCDGRKCPWWPYSSAKDFKANTALIIVVLFCALICALAFNAAIRYVIRLHCNRRRRGTQDDEKTTTAAVEVPAVIYVEGMKLAGEETECIICLTEFSVGEKIRVLEKCSHGFHVQCVQKWLKSHSSCPTCRANCSVVEVNVEAP